MNSNKRDEYKRKLAEQKQEIAELMAHVERLRLVAEMCGMQDEYIDYDFKSKVLKETPAQSLQQIKRDVANQAFDMMVEATNKAFMPHIEGVRAVFLNNLVKGGE